MVIFNNAASAEVSSSWVASNSSPLGSLRGGSFTVTFAMDGEEYTDIFTFGLDRSFIIASLSEIENSTGYYVDLWGVLFFANFSGSFLESPFSYSFYGLYLSSNIFGINVIELSGSVYTGNFSGTEIEEGAEDYSPMEYRGSQ